MKLRARVSPPRRAFRPRRGFDAGRLVTLRAAALKDAFAAPVRCLSSVALAKEDGFGGRGCHPITGDARAPVGLLSPRSLAAFGLVALDVGVALLFVRHFAREVGKIFLPPRRFLLLLAVYGFVDVGA